MSTFLPILIFVGICAFTIRTILKNKSAKATKWDGTTGVGGGPTGGGDDDTNKINNI